MKNKKKLTIMMISTVIAVLLIMTSALACTMVYVGSDLTEDGSSYMARSEDYSNSYNKVAYVSPAGLHKEGDVYEGCYGFTYTFTHDSYSYTAVRDDNLSGVCPNCDGTHDHTPMEECGTNEMGVSVSAMVTLSWKGNQFKTVDAMVSGGMCESDMTTILLSEVKTAKEGVELLIKIYETIGAEERSGVLIGDKNEIWYVENYTGHQYIGVKLSSDMIAISPNMGTIGLVDLDDAENVIASANVIKVAQDAGSFVGDAEKNQIDFRASYSSTSINSRMINGLNYFLGALSFTSDNTTSDDFVISNVKNGEIVTLYTNIETDRTITTSDVVDFYKVDGIGNTSNLEWHIFQINSELPTEQGTVEWLAMENGQYTVAIPYYSALTTDMYDGYKVTVGKKATSKTIPETTNPYYESVDRKGNVYYTILPDGWAQSYYWSVNALSNTALSKTTTDEQKTYIAEKLAEMQDFCNKKQAEMAKNLATMDISDAKAYVTKESAALAKQAHALTIKLYNYLKTGEKVDSIECGAKYLKDVGVDAWYLDYVSATVNKGFMVGTGDDKFEPEANITRAMVAQLLYNLEGKPTFTAENPFEDVADGEWYAAAVSWAYSEGLVKGVSATEFEPEKDITREDFAVLLYRYAEKKGYSVSKTNDLSAFVDAEDIEEYALTAMKWAVGSGLINGVSEEFIAPTDNATRAQIATIMVRFDKYFISVPVAI